MGDSPGFPNPDASPAKVVPMIAPAHHQEVPAALLAPPARILVADDDVHILELVSLFLRRGGYEVVTARNGTEAQTLLRDEQPDLAVLDIAMPGPDGLQLCGALARQGGPPVILLTARSGDIDKVAGLRFGADDYVTKPFNPEELVARVEAVLRRTRSGERQEADSVLSIGRLSIDPVGRVAAIDGQALSLTPREFDLLLALGRFRGIALDRDRLLDFVWGTSFYASRTVDVHIARLREKTAGGGVRIDTVWGTGYRLVVEDAR